MVFNAELAKPHHRKPVGHRAVILELEPGSTNRHPLEEFDRPFGTDAGQPTSDLVEELGRGVIGAVTWVGHQPCDLHDRCPGTSKNGKRLPGRDFFGTRSANG
jgi:hypothetical protein